jgi:cyclase
MLTKRIIPCLDVKDGRTVKGIHFKSLRDAGDPVELAQRYAGEGADELVFLDITATKEKRKTLAELVRRIAQKINIPFTVGGGIGSVDEISELLHAGADKVSLNSAIVRNPQLINEAATHFGSQCITAAIDAKYSVDHWDVYIKGGSQLTEKHVLPWAQEVQQRGAGEILLTSMDTDGTQDGFDLELLQKINHAVTIPVIASGGAGTVEHCIEAIKTGKADAVLAASIFHFQEVGIQELKQALDEAGIPVRMA